MQPGFLLKKQEGEDEDVHEERRFRAHMEEALKNSLMDEVDDSFNPPAERGTRRRVDRTIERSKRSGKERVIVAGDGKEVTTGTVFEALSISDESVDDDDDDYDDDDDDDRSRNGDIIFDANVGVRVGTAYHHRAPSGLSDNDRATYNVLQSMDVVKVYWQEYPYAMSGGAFKADVYDKTDRTITSMSLGPVVKKRSKNWKRNGVLTKEEHELTEEERRDLCHAKVRYFREMKKMCWKKYKLDETEEIAFHLKYMHPTSKQEITFFHVLSGDLELLKGHELEEDVNFFLFEYKFPDVEKWRAKIVKDVQFAFAEMCDEPAFLRRPEVRLPSDEERKGIEEMLWPGVSSSWGTTTQRKYQIKEKYLDQYVSGITKLLDSPPSSSPDSPLAPGGAARKARVLTKTTTKKPTLTKEKPNNENKNTRSKASTTTHSFTAEDKDLLVFMVKETQKKKKNSHLDFRNFLEQTTLKEYKKRMLDPNRHEWKTLNEYVQTISKGYMNHLYEKYQNIRNETEVSEKTKATATTKLSRKQREQQQQQQQQQQSGNMIETLFESEPRVYPSDYSTFSELEQPLPPQQPTPEEQIQQQQIRSTQAQRDDSQSQRFPRKQDSQIVDEHPSAHRTSADNVIEELKEEIQILNREKNVLELENTHLKSENFTLLKENEKLKRNNERLLKVQDAMANLQQKKQQPHQHQQPSVWGQHMTSIPPSDDTSSIPPTNNNGFGSNEDHQMGNAMNAFEESPWLQDLLNDEPTLNGNSRHSHQSIPPGFENATHTLENIEGGAYAKITME